MTAGHKSYLLAAENEGDLKDWLNRLSSVLQQYKIQEEKRVSSLERGKVKHSDILKCLISKFQTCFSDFYITILKLSY